MHIHYILSCNVELHMCTTYTLAIVPLHETKYVCVPTGYKIRWGEA